MQTAVATAKVLIGGEWRESDAEGVFEPENPSTGEKLGREFPVSRWSDCDRALTAAVEAAHELEHVPVPRRLRRFLKNMRRSWMRMLKPLRRLRTKRRRCRISPRLKDVELPRTTDQLRQAAAAAREQNVAASDDRPAAEYLVRAWRRSGR